MTEICSFKNNQKSLNEEPNSYTGDKNMKKKERKNSINSSNLDSSFNNLNTEIKSIVENETDLSFSSNTNTELEENKTNIENLFDSKYWRVSKESISGADEPVSTYDSHMDKDSPSKKENDLCMDEKNSPKPFHSKYAEVHEMTGTSIGSNKQSTQSNEDEETKMIPSQNFSTCESNNSPLNKVINNENEENENKNNNNKKGSIDEEKPKEKTSGINNMNNNIYNNNKNLYLNGFNNCNNVSNFKYNNESEYYYPYDGMNYKNNAIPFFQGVYLPQQICSFIPNYNYQVLNKKNLVINNTNNKLEDLNSKEKLKDFHPQIENNINGQINPFTNSYMNKYNKKIDIVDLPLVLNQNNTQSNGINYRYPKLNFNMICCPQIQQVNTANQKQILEKSNNKTNILPEINNKENISSANDKKAKTSSTNNSSSNICPIIEQNNNQIKLNNKNFVLNKSANIINNNKGNLKGEKQILNLDDIVTGKDTRTTLMIRNIPIKYTDEILIEEINEFNGKYDCLYMPYDYEKNGNKGYAFINFVNPLHILYFYEKFNGKKWVHFESSKICELNCAHFQGINEIQKHAKNYKGQKKPSYYSRNENNENMIIPSKYILKLKKRFPKMQYTENRVKKTISIKSFE